MLPRRIEDYRTLLWVFVLTPALVALHYLRPDLGLMLLPVSCYFAIATGVIAHNHMHRPVRRGKAANELFTGWMVVLFSAIRAGAVLAEPRDDPAGARSVRRIKP
jgi:beta-carotene hydroxylase